LKVFTKSLILRYTKKPNKYINVFLQINNFIFYWIEYYPFDWCLKDKNGIGLRIKSDFICNKTMDEIYNRLLSRDNYLPKYLDKDIYLSKKYREALRAQISLQVANLVDTVAIAKHINKLDQNSKVGLKQPIIFLKGNLYTYLLAETNDDVIFFYVSKISSKFIDLFKILFRTITLLNVVDLKLIFKRKLACSRNLFYDNRGKIFIEYFDKNYSSDSDRSLNIWYNKNFIDSKRIVYFFQRFDSLLTQDRINKIEEDGFSWVNSRNMYFGGSPLGICKKIIEIIKNLPLPKKINFMSVWRYLLSLELYIKIEYWRKSIRFHNVKILMQIEEGSVIQYAQQLALKQEDGIMIGFTWSMPFSPIRTQDFYPQDIYFTWGDINRDWHLNSRFVPDRILTAGMLWDLNGDYQMHGEAIRKKYGKNVKYVLALTDISIREYTLRASIKYYKTFLNFAKNNNHWGILIKPKHIRKWVEIDPEISVLIDQLELEKRLVITYERLSPAIVATGADICIGMFINTAAVIAAKMGSFSICWDAAGCIGHPLYKSDNSFIVFDNLEDIVKLLNKFSFNLKQSLMNRYEDSVMEKIDPFNDRKAYERIGCFIYDYIGYTDQNIDKDSALNLACQNYRTINGNKMIADTLDINLNSKDTPLWVCGSLDN